METALKPMPATSLRVPEGVVQSGGDWAYAEFTGDARISSLGMEPGAGNSKTNPQPAVEEKRRILDLFRQ
jgi:penicillin-binding protein 1A